MGYVLHEVRSIPSSSCTALSPSGRITASVVTGQIKVLQGDTEQTITCRIGVTDICMTDSRIFLLYRDGKILIFDVETASQTSKIDIDTSPVSIQLDYHGDTMLVRWHDQSKILNDRGEQLLTINCAIDVSLIFLRSDYIILAYFAERSVTLQIKDQDNFDEHVVPGQFTHVCYDRVGLNLFLLDRVGVINWID